MVGRLLYITHVGSNYHSYKFILGFFKGKYKTNQQKGMGSELI